MHGFGRRLRWLADACRWQFIPVRGLTSLNFVEMYQFMVDNRLHLTMNCFHLWGRASLSRNKAERRHKNLRGSLV
jgi:hypothetical protein